jgi:hypothetical protein
VLDAILAELGIDGPAAVELIGDSAPPTLSSRLDVAGCAVASVSACLVAAADLAAARFGTRPRVTIDTDHIAAAVRTELWLQGPSGTRVEGFAPLSRLWPSADGWVRTHGNYPWHRAALLAALEVPDGSDADVVSRVGAAIAARNADEVERIVYAAGGLAVAARFSDSAVVGPLIERRQLGSFGLRLPSVGPLPASGVKVLDLTRVIAGPVGTRMLAALGANVLRVDNPHCPETPLHRIDGVMGKTSTFIDGTTERGRHTLHALLDEADVLVTGYRPGAMDKLGLSPTQVAAEHPGTAIITLSAWGNTDPRRGFDSLVQVATGIGWLTSDDGIRPGALPCQLLDHATGYLVAAAALAGLARRQRGGHVEHAQLSLVRTAQWLMDQGVRDIVKDPPIPDVSAYRVPLGEGWSTIAPPGRLDGQPLVWPNLPPKYGQAEPKWPA